MKNIALYLLYLYQLKFKKTKKYHANSVSFFHKLTDMALILVTKNYFVKYI